MARGQSSRLSRSWSQCGSTLNSQLSTLGLLSYFLKPLTDYRAVEAIDGDVKPIASFLFYDEFKQALRFHAETLVWEVAGLRLRAFGPTHRPPCIARHKRPARPPRAHHLT